MDDLDFSEWQDVLDRYDLDWIPDSDDSDEE